LICFTDLFAGQYFLTIGDNNYVDVTPTRLFESGYGYSGEITISSVGNVKKKKRKDL
jgi:hypothetical protein